MHLLAKSYSDKFSLEKLENEQDELVLFECLANNKQVVIAYDCDFNFEPAFKHGKKAHWALITGIYAPIALTSDQTEPDSIVDLNSSGFDQLEVTLEKIKTSFRENRALIGGRPYREWVYCVGKQGKSSQYGVWRLNDLIKSNQQLSVIDDEKINDDMFVKPNDRDLKRTLAAQYILLN